MTSLSRPRSIIPEGNDFPVGDILMTGKDRLDKVLAVAINPGAYEQEAVAALHKARELVKKEPNLAFDLPTSPLPSPDPADEASFEVEISGVSEFWLPIVVNTLSEQA